MIVCIADVKNIEFPMVFGIAGIKKLCVPMFF